MCCLIVFKVFNVIEFLSSFTFLVFVFTLMRNHIVHWNSFTFLFNDINCVFKKRLT